MNAQILDAWKRTFRTAIQVGIPAFFALAGAVPVILDLGGAYLSPSMRAALVAAAGAITVAAAGLARIMAIPAVNDALASFGLAGHSGEQTGSDSWTTALPTLQARQGGAHVVAQVDAYR